MKMSEICTSNHPYRRNSRKRITKSLLEAAKPGFLTDPPHLRPVESAVEVRGIPLKPKYGLNGAPKAFSEGCDFLLDRQQRLGAPFKPYFGLSGIPPVICYAQREANPG
jgi:hypothetical protein